MSDGRPTDREMEEVLREVGAETRYPQTPDVSRSVRSRLESEAARPVRRRWFESPALRVAAALVVVAVLAIPTIPFLLGYLAPQGADLSQSQSDGMQEGGGELERAPLPPSSAESVTSGSAADPDMPDSAAGGVEERARTDFGEVLDLTTEITPAEARRITGGPLPRLRIDGAAQKPDALYAADDSVVAVYEPRPGLTQMGETGIGAVVSYLPGSDVSSYLQGEEEDYRRVEGGYSFPDGSDLRVRIGTTSDLPGGAFLYESRGGTVVLRSALPESRAVDLTETS